MSFDKFNISLQKNNFFSTLLDKLPTCLEFYECLCQRSRSRTLPRLDQKTTLNLMNCQGQIIKNLDTQRLRNPWRSQKYKSCCYVGWSYDKYRQRQIREYRHQESWARLPASPCMPDSFHLHFNHSHGNLFLFMEAKRFKNFLFYFFMCLDNLNMLKTNFKN